MDAQEYNKMLRDDVMQQYAWAFDSFMARITAIEAKNRGIIRAICCEDTESEVMEIQRESIGRGSNYHRTVSVNITIEPVTKIIDGKAFGYIRPGVYGYPIIPDMED